MFASLKQRLYHLLRWSEKYTKTDMVYLSRGGSLSIAGQFCASLIALSLSIVIARYVPKEVYGQYKYVIAIVSLLGVFSLNGIGSAVLQSVARGFDGALKEGIRTTLRWSFAVFIGAISFGAYFLITGNTLLGISILLGGCINPFITSFNLYTVFLIGKKDFVRLSWYSEVVTNIIPFIALSVTAYLIPRPLPLLIAYFVSMLAATWYAYVRTIKRYRTTSSGVRDPQMISYGKHLSAIGILSGIANNIDSILLFHFVGAIDLAVYNFATGIVNQIKGPIKYLDSMIQTRFATRSDQDIKRSMRNKYLWLFAGTLTFAVLYILFAPYIYRFLFPAYMNAIPYSRVYALSLLGFAFLPASSYLTAKKRIRAQYINTIAGSLLQIACMVIGVMWWGLWGLIVARVVIRLSTAYITHLLYLFGSKDVSTS